MRKLAHAVFLALIITVSSWVFGHVSYTPVSVASPPYAHGAEVFADQVNAIAVHYDCGDEADSDTVGMIVSIGDSPDAVFMTTHVYLDTINATHHPKIVAWYACYAKGHANAS